MVMPVTEYPFTCTQCKDSYVSPVPIVTISLCGGNPFGFCTPHCAKKWMYQMQDWDKFNTARQESKR